MNQLVLLNELFTHVDQSVDVACGFYPHEFVLALCFVEDLVMANLLNVVVVVLCPLALEEIIVVAEVMSVVCHSLVHDDCLQPVLVLLKCRGLISTNFFLQLFCCLPEQAFLLPNYLVDLLECDHCCRLLFLLLGIRFLYLFDVLQCAFNELSNISAISKFLVHVFFLLLDLGQIGFYLFQLVHLLHMVLLLLQNLLILQ